MIKKILTVFLIIFGIYINYLFFIKNVFNKDIILEIPKSNLQSTILNKILLNNNFLERNLLFSLIYILNINNKINYGEFEINKNDSFYQIFIKITNPSNYYRKFSIIDGWQIYQFNENAKKELNSKFKKIKYSDFFADTYFYQKFDNIDILIENMKSTKNNFLKMHSSNSLFNNFSYEEIYTIASLVEKEGKTRKDKELISSVIFNRLDKNMKLDIDATTIFAITKGTFKLDRKLLLKDLTIIDDYNTYQNKGLPPGPICFVSMDTFSIVLQQNESPYYFYFYDERLKKHIFNETYLMHKKKLKEYRANEQ